MGGHPIKYVMVESDRQLKLLEAQLPITLALYPNLVSYLSLY